MCRARERLADLETQVGTFLDTHTGEVSAEVESGRDVVLKITRVGDEPPAKIGVVIGEVVYNLRAALDYIVYDLAAHDAREPQGGTQFPIEDTPEGFARRRPSYLKGVTNEHVAFIKELQPYNGGNWLALLRDLSNPDKHRHLTAIVGVTDSGVTVNRVERGAGEETQAQVGYVLGQGGHAGRSGVYGMPVGTHVHVDLDLSVNVAFAQGRPVVETLQVLQSQTAQLVQEFKPLFD